MIIKYVKFFSQKYREEDIKNVIYFSPLQKLQTLLLGPLSELSSVRHGDVRQRQLECVLQVLHGAGETLYHGWPLVLGIIGAVSDHHG